MKILIFGRKTEELSQKLQENATIELTIELAATAQSIYKQYDLIIDLDFDESPRHIYRYANLDGQVVIVAAVKQSLLEAITNAQQKVHCHLIGLNALPTFIQRPLWEMSLLKPEDEKIIQPILNSLGIDYQLVEDRVGMVTPRIISMIINEAHFTLQEGTATVADIDLAMKLGTNYPYGPFEWMEKIGVEHVYEVLEAVYQDTHNERYRVAPLLKRKYLSREIT